MIKSVFALVVLLHFCYNTELNINLNVEIMGRLRQLQILHKQKKVNITSSGPLPVPSRDNASSCVGDFTRKLNHLLDHVSVSGDYTNLLEELKANLRQLEPERQNDLTKCRQDQTKNRTTIFNSYIVFLKKLNNSIRR